MDPVSTDDDAARERARVRARSEVERLRDEQHGLVSRRQALEAGMTRVEVARLLRRGEWVAVLDGVYLGHNGRRTWHERAWAAVLWADPAASRDDLEAVAVLADACGSRRTTARHLLDALEGRPRVQRRDWLTRVLTDIATGTCSVLEHGYLDRVERAHGLPVAARQQPRPTRGGGTLQDVSYQEWATLVELDGRIYHSSPEARYDDLDRDLDNAVDHGELTLRIGYRQVFGDSCATAQKVGRVLQRRGWPGVVGSCPDCGAPDQAG